MIIDLKALLQKILKTRSVEKNALEYDMVFDTKSGSFTPRVAKSNKTINIQAEYNGGELVGMAVVEKPLIANGKPAVLSNTGLFINTDEIDSTDIMLFSTYADAINTIEELPKFSKTKKLVGYLTVFAAYQRGREKALTFVEVGR